MRSKITITDVARKVNISKSTVSQFLNNRFEYMSPETKAKIENAIKELGFRPNVLARGLKRKKSQTIGIIVPNVLYSFSAQVSRAIEDYCYKNGYQAIVCNSDDNPDKERKYIEMLIDKQVDGLISFPTGRNKKIFQDLALKKYPLVLIGRKIKNFSADSVVLDNIKASYFATKYFIDNGHRRISIITQPLAHQTPRMERVEGYRRALHDGGIPLRDELIKNVALSTIKDHLDLMRSLPEPPTAFLLGNDFILKELLIYVRVQGIKVPEQLSLIVFDQSPYVNLLNPSVSTVTQPTYEMGRKAAEVLLSHIAGKDAGEHEAKEYVFDGMLEIRET